MCNLHKAFARPLKVMATLGNRFFAGVVEENKVKKELLNFLSVDEKEKLTKLYRFPAKEHSIVYDRSIRYSDADTR